MPLARSRFAAFLSLALLVVFSNPMPAFADEISELKAEVRALKSRHTPRAT